MLISVIDLVEDWGLSSERTPGFILERLSGWLASNVVDRNERTLAPESVSSVIDLVLQRSVIIHASSDGKAIPLRPVDPAAEALKAIESLRSGFVRPLDVADFCNNQGVRPPPIVRRHLGLIERLRLMVRRGLAILPPLVAEFGTDCSGGRASSSGDEKAVPERRTYAQAPLREWYTSRVNAWPSEKTPPSREEDVADARTAGFAVAERKIHALRKEIAPTHWTQKGRRKTAQETVQ
jgi:hypothetical protein